jgi:hypothetical protein
MRSMKCGSVLVIVVLSMGISAMLRNTDGAFALTGPPYANSDCVRCHPGPVHDMATAGKKHRYVPCMGCHEDHPPDGKTPIAPCTKCHLTTRMAHFTIGGCLTCHTNPHTPLNIMFRGKVDCMYCHASQGERLKLSRNKHSALDCTACHDVHRKVPKCAKCHQPHLLNPLASCNQCHKAHTPRFVAYPADIPSNDCGECHQGAAALLKANYSKHKLMACTNCHQESHRAIPACQSCHGSPHTAGIMRKFSKCVTCHNSAHALNWFTTEVQEATANMLKKGK